MAPKSKKRLSVKLPPPAPVPPTNIINLRPVPPSSSNLNALSSPPKWQRRLLAQQDATSFFSKSKEDNRINHLLPWAAKLLVPDFIIGHPNLGDNLKALYRAPFFKPLRLAIIGWLIFVLAFGYTAVNSLRYGLEAFASTFADDTQAEFDAGTHSATQWDSGNSWLELTTAGQTAGSGDFTSSIKDSAVTATWNSLAWVPNRPTGKELPNNANSETDYTTGNANMTGNFGLWHLNESSGTLADSSGGGHTGSYSGSGYSQTGALNTALGGFSGFPLNVGDINDTDNSAYMTIEMWIYPITLGTIRILSIKSGSSQNQYTIRTQNTAGVQDELYFFIASSLTDSSTYFGTSNLNLTAGAWQHLAFVYDGTLASANRVAIYRNGVAASGSVSGTIPTTLTSSTVSAYFGSGATGGNASDSNLDEIAIYSRALSATEVADHYKRGALNLKYQVRSCNDSACSGESFIGPDGTGSDYYYWKTTNATTTPSFSLTNVSTNRYFQYKTYFTTSDTSYSPEVKSVTADYSNQAPATPSNSSPSNGAARQDLNATLTGSAYSDSESDTQANADWQVDDDADFATPVWTRTAGAGEITTTINSTNGTFANELSGKTELDHNTVYYWKVRYADGGQWSSYSTATSFTTNSIVTPINSSPTSTSTVATLTPLLIVSDFSDPQSGHTGAYAQWQIDNNIDFSSTAYDSGTATYSASRSIPINALNNSTLYYWRVRHQDSSSQWSSWSTTTSFSVQIPESSVTVIPIFGNTTVDQGDTVKIDIQVINLTTGDPINDATATISIFSPASAKLVDTADMSYLSSSNGIYRYSYTVPSTSGSYIYEAASGSGSKVGYTAANFEVRTIAADLTSTKSTVTSEATAQGTERTAQSSERTSQATERTSQAAERTSQATSRTAVTDIQTDVNAIQSNVDILIGALIVTQSTVSDASPSTTSFDTALTNATNDFYNNAVLTFTSGNLDGQSRRVSDYNGTTNVITLDPALTSAPANSDAFTIVAQNVRVEEQLASHETSQSSFRTSVTSSLTSIEGKIDTLTTTLNTVDTNLSSVQSTVNSLRTSQQKLYQVNLSDVSEIQAGNTYRAKVIVLDYQSNPATPSTAPTILIRDASRVLALATTTMTELSTGVYEYTSAVSSSATTGLWETIINVGIGGSADIVRNDYWQVTGAPAQVLVNSISDSSIPSISANVTITNEGGGAYEYQYEWCVVSSQDNQCGGNDDVYYASAAKLISAGADFNPTLTATVSSDGSYWFKVVVYYGTAASGASRSFTTSAEESASLPASSGAAGIDAPPAATNANIYLAINNVKNDLAANSKKLERALEVLGAISPSLQTVLSVNADKIDNLTDIQNKISDLRAISSATRRLIEQSVAEPLVETWMTFNSVQFNFLISNPLSENKTLKFKSYLPSEVRPEHIIDLSGLTLDYDPAAGSYFVHSDITLSGNETITKKVEIKDIWTFTDEEIKSLRDQAGTLSAPLSGTQYDAQGAVLKNEIEAVLNTVLIGQKENYRSPQDHIVAYRSNKEKIDLVKKDLEKLKDLAVSSGASRGIVGSVGGIQTFATWGIILTMISGFGILAAVIFSMWRHQTMLAALALGISKKDIAVEFGRRRQQPKPTSKIIPRDQSDPSPPDPPSEHRLIVSVVVIILAFLAFKFLIPLLSSRSTEIKSEDISALPADSSSLASSISPDTATNLPPSTYLQITTTPTGWLNVRSNSSLTGEVLTKVNPGEKYEYISVQDDWYEIILTDGRHGWISSQYAAKVSE